MANQSAREETSVRVAAPSPRGSDGGTEESLLWALLDAAPDGLLVVDEQGTMRLANRRVEELFGYARGDLFGQQVEILLPERSRPHHRRHRDDFATRPRVRSMGDGGQLLGLRRDGSEFPVDISLSPLSAESRNWVMAAVRDSTERQASEHRLRQSAVLDEDDRVARELGDTVIRGLFGAGLRLQALHARVGTDVQAEVDSIVTDIDASIREIRGIIFAADRGGAG